MSPTRFIASECNEIMGPKRLGNTLRRAFAAIRRHGAPNAPTQRPPFLRSMVVARCIGEVRLSLAGAGGEGQ